MVSGHANEICFTGSLFMLWCRCIHLSNNSIQKHYKNGERAEELPTENMWHCDEFKKYLKSVRLSHLHVGHIHSHVTFLFCLFLLHTIHWERVK